MLSTYDDAAQALNALLPSEVLRTEVSPGFFTLYGTDWHIVVFCHWWFMRSDLTTIDGDTLDEISVTSLVDSLIGRVVAQFEYATDRPEVALLKFADGSAMGIETDSDYEPWSLYMPQGSFTAALSDFR